MSLNSVMGEIIWSGLIIVTFHVNLIQNLDTPRKRGGTAAEESSLPDWPVSMSVGVIFLTANCWRRFQSSLGGTSCVVVGSGKLGAGCEPGNKPVSMFLLCLSSCLGFLQ